MRRKGLRSADNPERPGVVIGAMLVTLGVPIVDLDSFYIGAGLAELPINMPATEIPRLYEAWKTDQITTRADDRNAPREDTTDE